MSILTSHPKRLALSYNFCKLKDATYLLLSLLFSCDECFKLVFERLVNVSWQLVPLLAPATLLEVQWRHLNQRGPLKVHPPLKRAINTSELHKHLDVIFSLTNTLPGANIENCFNLTLRIFLKARFVLYFLLIWIFQTKTRLPLKLVHLLELVKSSLVALIFQDLVNYALIIVRWGKIAAFARNNHKVLDCARFSLGLHLNILN